MFIFRQWDRSNGMGRHLAFFYNNPLEPLKEMSTSSKR
jgi:hypothetical protein